MRRPSSVFTFLFVGVATSRNCRRSNAIDLGSGRKKEAEDAVRSAEPARFRVNPRLTEDVKAMK